MADSIVFSLPEVPDPGQLEVHWWHVVDGEVVESGTGTEWRDLLPIGPGSSRKQVAFAPAATVRLEFAERPPSVTTDRQAAAVARVAAIESSLGDSRALHSVSRAIPDNGVVTAIVDNGMMLAWLDWAAAAGADPDHIIPVAALLPLTEEWTEATFGNDRVVGRIGIVMPFEPGLTERIVGDADVAHLDSEAAETAIAEAAEVPPLDLRSGRFARRRRLFIDKRRVRELALLAAVIPLLMLVWGVAAIVKLNQSTSALDRQSLAVAERALGHKVALESAESELAQRAGSTAQGGLMAPLTELLKVLQAENSVSATELSYTSDGTLSTTLAAPTIEPISRVGAELQRDGYRITVVSRQSPDGRAMVDTTVRSRP